jgi:hypothetical protein
VCLELIVVNQNLKKSKALFELSSLAYCTLTVLKTSAFFYTLESTSNSFTYSFLIRTGDLFFDEELENCLTMG